MFPPSPSLHPDNDDGIGEGDHSFHLLSFKHFARNCANNLQITFEEILSPSPLQR